MAWQDIPNNQYWQYDDAPLDPGGAETALWATSTNGIRISASGDEIYVNCRHIPLHPTQDSFPNEINKTFWAATVAPVQVLAADNVSYDPDIYFRPGPIGVKYKRPNDIDLYIRPVIT